MSETTAWARGGRLPTRQELIIYVNVDLDGAPITGVESWIATRERTGLRDYTYIGSHSYHGDSHVD